MFSDDLEEAKKLLANASAAELRIVISQEIPESAARIAAEYLLEEMEEKRRAAASAEEERRHRELVEAAKATHPPKKSSKIVTWTLAALTSVLLGLVVAYLKGCFPEVLR